MKEIMSSHSNKRFTKMSELFLYLFPHFVLFTLRQARDSRGRSCRVTRQASHRINYLCTVDKREHTRVPAYTRGFELSKTATNSRRT